MLTGVDEARRLKWLVLEAEMRALEHAAMFGLSRRVAPDTRVWVDDPCDDWSEDDR